MPIRIEVRPRDRWEESVLGPVQRVRLYFLSQPLPDDQIDLLTTKLLSDPVCEDVEWYALDTSASRAGSAVEVALRPGVTDIEARQLERAVAELGLPPLQAATGTRYEFERPLDEEALHQIAASHLYNETIERYSLNPIHPEFDVSAEARGDVERIRLSGLDSEALITLSRDRHLSLNGDEMVEIQRFFEEMDRDPTDVELETLAQTWSEHCVHKTFRARIIFRWWSEEGHQRAVHEIDGLLDTYIRRATEQIRPDWLRSAFVDDAGIIAFDEKSDLAFKVETHNHPSALEPFGGANTGIGGVVRDILGVSARPIAATNVLCFGMPGDPERSLPDGVLHPDRIAAGVVAGIGDYGNKLGLPTVNGAVIYDDGYLANPLVFCGAAGILPRNAHPTEPEVGDRIIVIGGRTGRDGLHGATFSSGELTATTGQEIGSAVQIGDPITEKGLIELVEAARDEALYHAITDCGAGGLSSAVGEMGELLGVDVELRNEPLKYPGLTPWEIWLSEAQERMVLAVPEAKVSRFAELAQYWEVELRDLGRFSGDGWLRVRYADEIVAEMPMSFLHDGVPRQKLQAEYRESRPQRSSLPASPDLGPDLLSLLSHPIVSSKEAIIRTYDHEVRGGTIVRPFVGPEMDGPSDAAVLKPLGSWSHDRAFALSAGINPILGRRDPYAMAVSAVDEAFRNAVAVGADPDRIAILDNFCWGNPTLPDRLGALVRTCQGCYDAAVAYRAPFISGKDSLYNEFDGKPIPGTLLISAISIVPDMNRFVTSDLKEPANLLFLLGETHYEMGGSLYYHLHDVDGGEAPTLLSDPLWRYRTLHQAIRKGLVQSCHDLSEGGLGVALAEMCIGGRLGLQVRLPRSELAAAPFLFSESNGRLLFEVRPSEADEVRQLFEGLPLTLLARVTEDPRLRIERQQTTVLDLSLSSMVEAWKGSNPEEQGRTV